MMVILKRFLKWVKISWQVRKLSHSDTEHSQQLAQQALADLLSNSRGLPMKIGQVFAMNSQIKTLQPLVSSIEPQPLDQMIKILEKAWGENIFKRLQSIEPSVAAASLGQVHKAVLLTGEPVAIKIQYADMPDAVEAEMRLLGLLPSVGPVKQWGFDLNAYRSSLKDDLDGELDYLHEASNQQKFSEQVTVAGLDVADVYVHLCCKNILVQQWVEGDWFDAACLWPVVYNQSTAKVLLQTMLHGLFVSGLVHGDPHMGNSFYQRGEDGQVKVKLLDFGCVIELDKKQRLALLQLVLFARGQHGTELKQCFGELGFNIDKLDYLTEELPELCKLLFKPFVGEHKFDSHQWHLSSQVERLLGEKRWWFRSAGPSNLFLLMRAFEGVIAQLIKLDVELSWWPLLESILDPEYLNQAQVSDLAMQDRHEQVDMGSAQHLKIRVLENGIEKVLLSMPAIAALNLRELIPDHIYHVLEESDINIQMIEDNLQGALNPQQIFYIEQAHKQYRVWLE